MRITIPAYNAGATPVEGKNPTIKLVPGHAQTRVIRVTGTGAAVLTFGDYPGNVALNGLPLGADPDGNSLGELYTLHGGTPVWVASQAGTEIYVGQHA